MEHTTSLTVVVPGNGRCGVIRTSDEEGTSILHEVLHCVLSKRHKENVI